MDLDFEVKRLRMQAGDVLVVKAAQRLSQDACAWISAAVKESLPEGTKVLVLDAGLSISVLSPELAAALDQVA